MPLVKIFLILLATTAAFTVNAQDSLRFSVTLKGQSRDGKELPNVFDTVFLNRTFNQTSKIYTNIYSADSLFTVPNVPIGQHWLLFSVKSFCVWPVPIVVCTKCDNTFSFFTTAKKDNDDCNIFEMVEVSASYVGGNKAISKDFLGNLNKNEKKQLKSISDFKINFFVTKQREISDISFTPDSSQVLKDIVRKGLSAVTNWRPAIRNGIIADSEYALDKKTLLNK
jgi:hypothetical protein